MALPTSDTQQQESLQGTIERVTFHNEDNGFCVLRVKVSGERELQTVVGTAASVQAGEFIECEGSWNNNSQFGLQFTTTVLKVVPPTTIEGMEKYLASGMVKGVGAGFAKRLIETFGCKVFDIIEHEPHRLAEVPGLGLSRKQNIIDAWAEQRVVREIMVFLQSHGVGTAKAVRIYKSYGDNAIEKVRENPYRLAEEIHGIGFKSADALAQKLGVPHDSLLRVRAGVVYCLKLISANGHCGVEQAELEKSASQLLGVGQSLIVEAINEEVENESIIKVSEIERTLYFSENLFQAEQAIAYHIHRLNDGETRWCDIQVDDALENIQSKTNIQLSPSQREAVELVIQNKVAIITGGPGVGKTTIVNSILHVIRTRGVQLLLGAPTGRAAKRLSESTGLEAKTIHRLLEYDPSVRQFKRNESNPLEADMIVIDESSMVDVRLMQDLLAAIPNHAALLLVGDVDQLPSVGPGAVLQDLINSNKIPTAKLTEIFRQAETSEIIVNAHKINRGEVPTITEKSTDDLSDFYYIPCENPSTLQETVINLVSNRIPQRFNVDPIEGIQVLTPTKKGALGTVSLNIALQKKLNPQKFTISRFGSEFGEGDKVVQIVNNYDKEVFNGDIGLIKLINKEEANMLINFQGRDVLYEFTDLDEITLAYATTIHKSQGSEYPVVVIPLATQHYNLLQRNLVYTAVTRGKGLVVVVAQRKAIQMAVNRLDAATRLTYLKELLEQTNEHVY